MTHATHRLLIRRSAAHRQMPQHGFTLLEVLIALVVLALALGAVIRVSGQSAALLDRLRADTAATVTAEDLCTRLALAATAPTLGSSTQPLDIEGQAWTVKQQVEAAAVTGVFAVTYFVETPAPFSGQASMLTYFYQPPGQGTAQSTTSGTAP